MAFNCFGRFNATSNTPFDKSGGALAWKMLQVAINQSEQLSDKISAQG
jgi:hypothetical protein